MTDAIRSPSTNLLLGEAALVRAVGSFALTAAVINIIVGGGIFRMPSALSAQMGAAAPLALVAGALAWTDGLAHSAASRTGSSSRRMAGLRWTARC